MPLATSQPVPTVKIIGAILRSLSLGMIGAAGTITSHQPFCLCHKVSAYTPAGFISNFRYDFGSILRFIEHNFGIPEGQLTFADRRATKDLTGFFDLNQAPRPFQRVSAVKDATYFLNDKRVPTDPDDD